MFKLCCLSILLCLLAPSCATTPGTIVRVHQEALEYVSQEGKPFLLQGLSVLQIPNMGSLLNIVGLKILKVQLPNLSVKLVANTGVQVSLSTEFHIRANLLIAPLELRVGSSIRLDVHVARSPHGFPILTITACKSILGDVQIILGGSNLLGWLKPIQNHIRAVLMDKLCLSVSSSILGLNAKLGTLVDLNVINSMSNLQYSLMGSPTITDKYIELAIGAVFSVNGNTIDNGRAQDPGFSLSQSLASDKSMMNLGLSEYILNNVFFTLQQSAALNHNIGGQSGSGSHHFTTSMLESAIPSIRKWYPQEVALELQISVGKAPIINMYEGGAVLRLSPSIKMVVGASGPSSQILFTLKVDMSLGVQLAVRATSLQASVSLHGDIGVEVESSSVQIVEVSQLTLLMHSIMVKEYVAHLNDVMSVTILLPKISGIQYVDPQVEFHKGFAQVNTDLKYV